MSLSLAFLVENMLRGLLCLMVATFVVGCDLDDIFGTGVGAEAEASTPAGIQSQKVTIVYTLSHETITATDIRPSFSLNGGGFREATEVDGEGSGMADLAVSEDGVTHTFVWDSTADLEDGRFADVVFRVTPENGNGAATGPFSLHNTVFLAATHEAEDEVSLYEIDLVDGEMRFLVSTPSGGDNPYDIVLNEGIFYVANRSSNSVSALELDVSQRTLTELEESPFNTGGLGGTYLATDDDHLFVSNGDSGTISIFDIDASTGTLTLSSNSGVSAVGCRSMVVRSDRLFVASETLNQIVIFDIEPSELVQNAFSPVAPVGADGPRAMVVLANRLFVANYNSATVCGLSFLGGGDLLDTAGSPFSYTDAGVEDISGRGGDRLFLAGGVVPSVTTMTVDVNGVASQDAGSPITTIGLATGVVAKGDVVVLTGGSTESFDVFLVADDGTLSPSATTPVEAGRDVTRVTVSD